MPVEEARRNEEIVSLADSQLLRWIDELNGIVDADLKAKEIRAEIKRIWKEPYSIQNRRKIRELYKELDKVQLKPDYLCLVIDSKKDYYRANKGFSINGTKYKRLLGTNGGIKNSTIVFVSERLHEALWYRIENERDSSKELVTAKLEAYKALTCSASIPVSMPKGVLVVHDAKTEVLSEVLYLTDEGDGEPLMSSQEAHSATINASDGYGIMLPSLAQKWSSELSLDYMVSGVNTRFSFEKGMVFTFDFLEFAERIAGKYEVEDAWGDKVDIRDVEIILTTSMVKLWDSYDSCKEYLEASERNGYTFGISKVCPRELESERNLNYQFIQSYDLDDDDIEELIAPTMNEIKDVLQGDWRKTILFLKGFGLSEKSVKSLEDDYAKAIMIDQRMMNDSFIQNNIYQLIQNRINKAKVGVLKVHGNYSVVSGDPYLLCQSIFGMKKTGLLKSGEIYNQYWDNIKAGKLACFRAPMTCHNNIRLVSVSDNKDARYWYRYMTTATILNAWDTATIALNGCDFDGDLVMLTDNDVLVRNLKPLPALLCVQRDAKKGISTEDDFVRSNIESFGNDIGQTTNWITSMFEVRANYTPDSLEYKELSYRIRCGQLFQQNSIDKAKGIISKPMPRTWHDRHSVNKIEDDEERDFYRSIVADKKPYFMRYIYPTLMNKYNTYIRNTDRNSLRRFQLTVNELKEIPYKNLTSSQKEFLRYFEYRMPVGTSNCVMNKICRRFEEAFDERFKRFDSSEQFDYRIMRSSTEYTSKQYQLIRRLYEDYNKRLSSYSVFAKYERVDEIESYAALSFLNEDFRKECSKICPNAQSLCSVILDICYTQNSTKRFAWSMCGTEIIHNLLNKNNNTISFPVLNEQGDVEYGGLKFCVASVEVEVSD